MVIRLLQTQISSECIQRRGAVYLRASLLAPGEDSNSFCLRTVYALYALLIGGVSGDKHVVCGIL